MKKTFKQILQRDIYGYIKKINALKDAKGNIKPREAYKRFRMTRWMDTIKDKMYTTIGHLSCEGYYSREPLPFDKKFEGLEVNLGVGKSYAKAPFDCAWLHVTGTIPTGYSAEDVVFLIDTAGEGLVYDKAGNVKQGITTYASEFSYDLGMPEKKVVFCDGLTEGDKVDFFIDCGANDLFGNLKLAGAIQQLDIAVPNQNIIGLFYDLEVLLSVFDNNKNDAYIQKLYSVIQKCFENVESLNDEKAKELREGLKEFLQEKNDDETFRYTAIGHAHLDLAWLWPIRESYRKGARTFSNQLTNIEKYDDYIFGASQAQLYDWVKTRYPKVYEDVKKKIEEKRWEVQGATWVEMDSNLTSGESLIRQFYYGKKFFQKEFGLDMKILWLPDSFGYSACLPQVMASASVPYFLTQKMSWNTVNKFPYHTFRWYGLDGTEVLAHMLPEDTYNGPATGDRAVKGEKNYRERKVSDMAVSLFGIGDGGAGPGFDHIERATRMKDIKGLPKYNFGMASDFFKELEKGVDAYPKHEGELYLEKHQGTYTTRVHNKKNNRRMEFLLQNYEKLLPLAEKENIPFPIESAELERIWKEVLLYQFHDILPGSSINRVYEETDARYKSLMERVSDAIQELCDKLFTKKSIINFNSFDYSLPMKVDGKWLDVSVPSYGSISVSALHECKKFFAKCGKDYVENDKVKVVFKKGTVLSVWDKENKRELITPKKRGNVFTEYVDAGDCWDFMPRNYKSRKKEAKFVSMTTGCDGAKAFAKLVFMAEETKIEQEIYIIDHSAEVSFATKIDRKAKSSTLRVSFPINIKTDKASFNIQFGHIKRKTTEENSIEKAQFEVSGQKFVDVSEAGYGVSVLNDCKYGYRVKNGVIDIALVRSPMRGPGKEVDQGISEVTYTLYPHSGALSEKTYKQAYLLNNPLLLAGNNEKQPNKNQLISSTNPTVLIETIKKAEDGRGFIVRVYNCSDKKQKFSFMGKKLRLIEEVNILEERIAPNQEEITLKGFSFACYRMEI